MGVGMFLKVGELCCMRRHPNVSWHAGRPCIACNLELPQSFEKIFSELNSGAI